MQNKPEAETVASERDHEKTDINLKAIGAWLIVFFVGALVVHAALFWWLDDMNGSATLDEAKQGKTRARSAMQAPRDFPKLQITPKADWESYLTQQQQQLNSYGWIDRTAGVARIPIKEAIDIIAKSGMPRGRSSNQSVSPLILQHQRAQQQSK
jgi:hypothetical protein